MKLTTKVLGFLLIGALSMSCGIREDLGDCYSINWLQFSYLGDENTEIFPEKIDRVELFVFDDKDSFVSSVVVPDSDVAARITQLPPLRAGNYRIVCIANTHNTETAGVEGGDYRKRLFASDDHFSGRRISTDDPLYYASVDYEVEPFETQIVETVETAYFASSHYDFLVEVEGLAQEKFSRIEVSGLSPATDFENTAKEGPSTYLLDTEYDSSAALHVATANIMRHKNHEDVNVNLFSTDGTDPLVTVNLKEFLDANPLIDCSKHEVLIPIRIKFVEPGPGPDPDPDPDGNCADVIIELPDWYVVEVKPEF